ncbi:MAG: hypothetical protein U0169_03090 [Polyangiaceae bacterium]
MSSHGPTTSPRTRRWGWVVVATAVATAGCPNSASRECRDVIRVVNVNVDRATTALARIDADGGDPAQLDELVKVLEGVKADFDKVHVDDATLRGHVERYDAMLERMVAAGRAVRTATQGNDPKGVEHALAELAAAGKDEDHLVVELNAFCGGK